MKKKVVLIAGIFLSFFCKSVISQDTIPLLSPSTEGGMSLTEALQNRKSTRSFSEEKLSDRQLSDLLWAAFGINRQGEGKRTAPSSRNQQEIDIYVFTEEGVFIYNAQGHSLIRVADKDLRKYTGTQGYVEKAAVNLVYIADHSKSKSNDPVDRSKTSNIDTGFIAQNVYLYCASQGLGCVVRGSMDKAALANKLNLREDQEIIVAQSIGVIN